MITVFYFLVLEQILQGFYSLWQGVEWLKMARRRLSAATGFYAPRVALICPIKGMEQDLEGNLSALIHFEYPQYEIFFAVAAADDPAYQLLERVASVSKRPVHIVRAGRALDCSDKVHNLAAAVAQLDDQFDVLVFTDSDGQAPSALAGPVGSAPGRHQRRRRDHLSLVIPQPARLLERFGVGMERLDRYLPWRPQT